MELVWSKMKQPYGEYCIGEIIKVTATIKKTFANLNFLKKNRVVLLLL